MVLLASLFVKFTESAMSSVFAVKAYFLTFSLIIIFHIKSFIFIEIYFFEK